MENREYDEYADRGIDKMILATTPDEAIDQAEQFLDRIGVNYMDFLCDFIDKPAGRKRI